MDYFLSCDDAEPADLNDADEQYSETLVRLTDIRSRIRARRCRTRRRTGGLCAA